MKLHAVAFALLLCLAPTASAQWIPVPNPPDSFQGVELFFAGEDRIYSGTFNGRVFGSTDHADTWTEIADGLPEATCAMVMAMEIVGDWFIMSRFGLTAEDDLNFRSHRNGDAWSTWEPLGYQNMNFHSFAVIGETLFAVRGDSMIDRTDDYGASWSTVSAPIGTARWEIFAHEGLLFAAEQVINGGTMYRSDDLGATWTEIAGGLGSSYVCSDILWQGRLLVCVYHGGGIGGFWSSTDFGNSWEEITTLPTGSNINGMVITEDGRLAIGAAAGSATSASIWLSDDLANWEDYTGDLPWHDWPFMSFVAHDGWFFKTGGSNTDYRAPQPVATAVEDGPTSSRSLALAAQPNPFNPTTAVTFRLSTPGHAMISIYDVAGRRLRVLVNREMPAGSRSALWDGEDDAGVDAASGVYFARLEAGDFRATRKMVLVR